MEFAKVEYVNVIKDILVKVVINWFNVLIDVMVKDNVI